MRASVGTRPAETVPEITGDQSGCDSSEHQTAISQLCSNLQRLLWLLAAASVVVYGNGHHDFFTVVLHHPAVWKNAYYMGTFGVAMNISVFVYLTFKDVLSDGPAKGGKGWEVHSPVAIHLGTAAGVTAVTGFLAAFWPIWSILTPLVLFLLFMGLVMSISLLPAFSIT